MGRNVARYKIIVTICLFSIVTATTCRPFLQEFPLVQKHIPHICLGDFPTPIQPCTALSAQLGCRLFIKRDDLSGALQPGGYRLFGGNKVRKLEFILADALRNGAQSVLTLGCAGSNHALATSVYAHQLGLQSSCLLAHQPHSWVVERNLLLQHYYNGQLYFFESVQERNDATDVFLKKDGVGPYFIVPGGSMPIGVMGFVNAAYELREQIDAGYMLEPDYIYVAAGSFGSSVGLLIGLQLVGLDTQVVAVAVEPDQNMREKMYSLFQETIQFLCQYDPSFATISWQNERLLLRYDFCGPEYGAITQDTQKAIALFMQTEDVQLDTTYTAKAAAALVHDAQRGFLQAKTVLFWHTFCGDVFDHLTKQVCYTALPKEFHTYFQ